MNALSGIFGGGKSDNSAILAAQQRQADAANKRQAELDAQEAARRNAATGRNAGRASLLGPSGEVGVSDLKPRLGG